MASIENLATTLEMIIQCGVKTASFLPKKGVISQEDFDRLAEMATNNQKLISKIDEALNIRSESERADALDELSYCCPLAQELIKLRKAV